MWSIFHRLNLKPNNKPRDLGFLDFNKCIICHHPINIMDGNLNHPLIINFPILKEDLMIKGKNHIILHLIICKIHSLDFNNFHNLNFLALHIIKDQNIKDLMVHPTTHLLEIPHLIKDMVEAHGEMKLSMKKEKKKLELLSKKNYIEWSQKSVKWS